MKKFKISLLGICVLFMHASILVSCSEDTMDKINKDINNPEDVQSQFIATELFTSTAFSVVGSDLSFYSSVYVEHEGGFWGQFYNAETRSAEPSAASTYNNSWGAIYDNIKNAKIVIAKCSEGGEEASKKSTLGVAQIMLAYNTAVLTDLFGDVPYSEAGINGPDGKMIMQPKIDTQQEIYASIMKNLDDAIANLEGAANTLGDQDLIYKGNSAAWQKVAYGLKARYTMRLLGRSASKDQDMNNVLDYISKSFTSSAGEFKFNIYDGSTASNPYFQFWWDRDNYGASQSFATKLTDRNDPRLYEIYINDVQNKVTKTWDQLTDPTKFILVPNGESEQIVPYYSVSTVSGAVTAPTLLLSYHELLFLKAEALCRLGRTADAEPVLKEAIGVAFKNFAHSIHSAITEAGFNATTKLDDPKVAEDYFNNTVKALFTANPLKETMVQKYLAMQGANGESLETYNDIRRMQGLGESFITLNNPKNATQFPFRFTYGSSDVQANTAVGNAYGDGQYVYSEKVWWAGGSR